MNYFIFKKNGNIYDSRDYGIGCGGFPPIVIPQKRCTFETIPGRDGTLTSTDDCYDSYPKTIECYMEDDVYKDLSWLSGRGKLVLSNELEREYDVTIKNNIELEQIATYWRNFLINFEVQPYKKSPIQKDLLFNTKIFDFEIGGDARCKPLISVKGSGEIIITINGSSFKIKNLENTILIDSELEVVQKNSQNASSDTTGEFPILYPGNNNVVIVGNLEKIEFIFQETYL